MDTTIMKQYSNGSNNTNSVLRRASQFESRQQDNSSTTHNNVVESNSGVGSAASKLPRAHHATKMPTPRSSLKRRVTPPNTNSNICTSTTSLSMTPTSVSSSSSSLPRESSSLPPIASTSGSTQSSTIHGPEVVQSLPNFYSRAFNRFQTEFSSLYPDDRLPFDEIKNVDDVVKQVKSQQSRINEIQKELSVSKFVLKFLESINSHRDHNDSGKLILIVCVCVFCQCLSVPSTNCSDCF